MSVVIETTLGDITVDLYLEQRPVTCLNFLKLCKMKYYNFNLFHSIRSGFIAQTGDPTAEGSGGKSIFGLLEGPEKRFFSGEKLPKIRHTNTGTLSMVCTGDLMVGSQFFFTLAPDLDSLDGIHCVIGEVTEGHDVLRMLNDVICDESHRPYRDVRITHTVVLEDPFNDPPGLRAPSRSPSPSAERLKGGRIAPDEDIDEAQGKSAQEIQEMIEEKEAKARATILEIVGDLPDADIAPPENVLFVCKLNPVTTDEDLEIIFSRFGKIVGCEVIRDKKTGDSLQYAFIEFSDKKSCEDAYFKMDNVLIDDRRIHVDFSQSVSRMRWMGKGKGIKYFNNNDRKGQDQQDNSNHSNKKERDRDLDNGKTGDNNRRRERSKDRKHSDKRDRDHKHEHKNRDSKHERRDRDDKHERSHKHERDKHSRSDRDRSRRDRSRSRRRSSRERESRRDKSDRRRSRHNESETRSETKDRHKSRHERSRSRERSRHDRDKKDPKEKSPIKCEKKLDREKSESSSRKKSVENKSYEQQRDRSISSSHQDRSDCQRSQDMSEKPMDVNNSKLIPITRAIPLEKKEIVKSHYSSYWVKSGIQMPPEDIGVSQKIGNPGFEHKKSSDKATQRVRGTQRDINNSTSSLNSSDQNKSFENDLTNRNYASQNERIDHENFQSQSLEKKEKDRNKKTSRWGSFECDTMLEQSLEKEENIHTNSSTARPDLENIQDKSLEKNDRDQSIHSSHHDRKSQEISTENVEFTKNNWIQLSTTESMNKETDNSKSSNTKIESPTQHHKKNKSHSVDHNDGSLEKEDNAQKNHNNEIVESKLDSQQNKNEKESSLKETSSKPQDKEDSKEIEKDLNKSEARQKSSKENKTEKEQLYNDDITVKKKSKDQKPDKKHKSKAIKSPTPVKNKKDEKKSVSSKKSDTKKKHRKIVKKKRKHSTSSSESSSESSSSTESSSSSEDERKKKKKKKPVKSRKRKASTSSSSSTTSSSSTESSSDTSSSSSSSVSEPTKKKHKKVVSSKVDKRKKNKNKKL